MTTFLGIKTTWTIGFTELFWYLDFIFGNGTTFFPKNLNTHQQNLRREKNPKKLLQKIYPTLLTHFFSPHKPRATRGNLLNYLCKVKPAPSTKFALFSAFDLL